MERISSYQLFSITVFLQLGTTVIFGFASSAGRDAWLVVLLSMVIGICIIFMFTVLAKLNPGLSLVEWYPAQLGKWIGIPLAWMYPLLFTYSVARIYGDLKDLIPSTILPATPHWAILGGVFLLLVYGLFSGLEVLARLAELLFPLIVLLFFIVIIMLFFSGIVDFNKVFPIVGDGWRPIFEAVWPLGVTQTFLETLALAMIWPLMNNQKLIRVTILGTLLSGTIIALFDFIGVAVLGENMFERSVYPLYVLVKQISIADFLENMEVIGVLYFSITAFMKIYIYSYIAIRCLKILLKTKSEKGFILPFTLVSFIMGITAADSVTEHFYIGTDIFPLYVWVPLLLILPSFLFIVTLVRYMWAKQKNV